MSDRAARLDALYRASVYVIQHGETRFEACIDRPHAGLAALLRDCGVDGAALLSACNPDSQALAPEQNLARQRALEDQLYDAGWAFLPALGRSPDGDWQEPSVLVLGLAEPEAGRLAAGWGQRAWVQYDSDGCGRLRFVAEAGA